MGAFLGETKETFSELTLFAIEAALEAGEILRAGFGTHFSISSKEGKHNLVTEYDHKAEKSILSFLRKNVPESHFLAEESGLTGTPTDRYLWIVDPLDGTVNFAHHIPFFSVSIALEKQGELLSGVVYQPMLHELFVAEKNKGAYLNGKRLEVSKVSDLSHVILATGFPYHMAERPMESIAPFIEILKQGSPIRRLGSAAIDLAYTAAGRFDGFFESSLSPWDVAAGKLLIEEAGGQLTHWDLTPFDLRAKQSILATNGKIHKEASQVLMKGARHAS